MSFTGNLEHLSIVDIMQLLHATRKSGILRVQGKKGESRLVFKDGFIVSARHLNVRIGRILQDLGMISPEELDRTLREQKAAGDQRKPLIVTLIEKDLIQEKDAYKSLQTLIEMTVVEILTWKTGKFSLDITDTTVSDDYQYYPEKISKEINIDTQRALMDALRIYDEKKRDGELEEDFEAEKEIAGFQEKEKTEIESDESGSGRNLSAEDLGLADLDSMETHIPGVFRTLRDMDPVLHHREKIEEIAPRLAEEQRDALVAFLKPFPFPGARAEDWKAMNATIPDIVLCSRDPLLEYALAAVCGAAGLSILAPHDEKDFSSILDGIFTGGKAPVLLLDDPEPVGDANESAENPRLSLPRNFPRNRVVQLVSPLNFSFAINSLEDVFGAYFPRPRIGTPEGRFSDNFILFLRALPEFLKDFSERTDAGGALREGLSALLNLKSDPDVAFALLRFVTEKFERTIAFVVRKGELIAEKSIGIETSGSGAVPGLTIPLKEDPLLSRVVEKGVPFYDRVEDGILRQKISDRIGSSLDSRVLLLPVRVKGRTVSLIYGDSARGEAAPGFMEVLEVFSHQAGLMLENSFYRRKMGKASH